MSANVSHRTGIPALIAILCTIKLPVHVASVYGLTCFITRPPVCYEWCTLRHNRVWHCELWINILSHDQHSDRSHNIVQHLTMTGATTLSRPSQWQEPQHCPAPQGATIMSRTSQWQEPQHCPAPHNDRGCVDILII